MNTPNNAFLFAAVVGSGLTAKAADNAGAHYLLALNAGRFRVQGASSLTSFLPVRPACDWVEEFAERELLGRCTSPIFAGLSVSDPLCNIGQTVERFKSIGFEGICNFPSTTSIDGRLGAAFEREGLGFDREIALVEAAAKLGLGAFVYVKTNKQARRMVEAGATAICVDIGFTGGPTGVETFLTIDTAANRIDQVLDGVPANIDRLCHGGPITSPEQALALTRICGVQGFVAGSTLDRIPIEQTLNEVTKGFTAIPSLVQSRIDAHETDQVLVGSSEPMRRLRVELRELSHDPIPVLFTGETGTGKSLTARRLHDMGPVARRKPLIIDCPAIDSMDGGAHLLGYAAGYKAGAASHRGALEQAAGSSLIFEEICGLAPDLQGKILKFVDEGVVQRIGDHSLRDVATRMISTTIKSFEEMSDSDSMRKDLLFRISGHVTHLLPLRERVEDIPELVQYFSPGRHREDKPKFTNAALRLFIEHHWPGNIRELRHAVWRAVRAADGQSIDLKAVEFLRKPHAAPKPQKIAPLSSVASERDWIAASLARNGFRRAQTAEDLGMTTRTLYNKIRKYGILT